MTWRMGPSGWSKAKELLLEIEDRGDHEGFVTCCSDGHEGLVHYNEEVTGDCAELWRLAEHRRGLRGITAPLEFAWSH